MKFGNLHFLWLLWLIPLLIIFYGWAFRKKMALINLFVEANLRDRLLQGVSFSRQKLKAFLLILAFLMFVVALIRPKWGFHWEEVKRKGVDIIVALDVSKSMLAQDVSPNRLERAKREIIDLLELMEGDRVGLIAFAGTSFLQGPLTLDYGAIRIFLDELDTELIPIPGTDIDHAISLAIKSFNQEDKKSRVLILITDGEDHEGDPLEMAKKASKEGIKIYTIGIGKEGGSPIPDPANGGLKKDQNGELILSHLDEGTLQKIALSTGGSYVRSITGDLDLEKIYFDIQKTVEDKDLKSGRRQRFEERFQWPLLLGLILLFLESFLSERRPAKNGLRKRWSWKFFGLFMGMLFIFSDRSQASLLNDKGKDGEDDYKQGKYSKALQNFTEAQIERPSDYALKYNMANTYYKMKQYPEAEKLFQSVAEQGDRDLAQKAYYNLGLVAYQQGKLQEAVDYFKKALELDPNDEDSKANLKFIQEEIKKRIEENKKRQENQKGQNQNQNQDQKQEQKGGQGQENQQEQKGQSGQQEKNQKGMDEKQNSEQSKEGGEDQQKKEEQKGGKEEDENKQEKGASAGEEGGKEKKEKDEGEDQYKALNQDKQDKENKTEGKDGGNATGASKGEGEMNGKEMSEQEANRWLSTLEEDRKKYLNQKMQGSRKYRVDKDW